MTFIVDGTNGLTFPNSTTQASAGNVLQVVQANNSTQFTTTSTTFVSSGISASITPKFSTSKILVLANIPGLSIGAGPTGWGFALYRGATQVFTQQNYAFYTPSTQLDVVSPLQHLDSPATTSSTTYNIYLAAFAGTAYINYASQMTTNIILMEIAA
jgi:hypothetical protein